MFGKNTVETPEDVVSLPEDSSPPVSSTHEESDEIIAFVGEEVIFKGTIWYQGTIRVDGRLEGAIYTDGNLIIGQKAVVTAKIEAGTVTCQGLITGEIVAKNLVKLLSPAVFDGSITTPLLSMEEGVMFNGSCNMPKQDERKGKEIKLVVSVEEAVKVK
ncbi:MAG: polymer-forming cytoskeletal protein [Nitrospirota bacterium]|nr:polymer-forming cytoskeletal protein [Nitrospirota bacterium]